MFENALSIRWQTLVLSYFIDRQPGKIKKELLIRKLEWILSHKKRNKMLLRHLLHKYSPEQFAAPHKHFFLTSPTLSSW